MSLFLLCFFTTLGYPSGLPFAGLPPSDTHNISIVTLSVQPVACPFSHNASNESLEEVQVLSTVSFISESVSNPHNPSLQRINTSRW